MPREIEQDALVPIRFEIADDPDHLPPPELAARMGLLNLPATPSHFPRAA